MITQDATTPSHSVLNPALYEALHRFGVVSIYSEGEKATFDYDRPSLMSGGNRYVWAHNVKGGERYATKCPFCQKDGKMWLSYLYNTKTELDGAVVSFGKKLVTCFRCHFEDNKEMLKEFWSILEDSTVTLVAPLETAEQSDGKEEKVTFPRGVLISDPLVPGRIKEYLTRRGFDLDVLAKVYNIWYSEDTDVLVFKKPAIIFPVFQNKEMVGWQGRHMDEDIEGTKIPKYVFPKHMHSKWLLYGSDIARWQPNAVIVEGVTDALKVGPSGIAVFGKTVSPRQIRLLVGIWGSRGIIRIPDMNDPEALGIAQRDADIWNGGSLFKEGVKIVIPPSGIDPGKMGSLDIQKMIHAQTGITIAPGVFKCDTSR